MALTVQCPSCDNEQIGNVFPAALRLVCVTKAKGQWWKVILKQQAKFQNTQPRSIAEVAEHTASQYTSSVGHTDLQYNRSLRTHRLASTEVLKHTDQVISARGQSLPRKEYTALGAGMCNTLLGWDIIPPAVTVRAGVLGDVHKP